MKKQMRLDGFGCKIKDIQEIADLFGVNLSKIDNANLKTFAKDDLKMAKDYAKKLRNETRG